MTEAAETADAAEVAKTTDVSEMAEYADEGPPPAHESAEAA
jgi:hypothetical protein